MDKIGYGRHTESGEPIVLLRDLPEILLKVNELVEGYNEIILRYGELRIDIDGMWGGFKLLTERLDNHINKDEDR